MDLNQQLKIVFKIIKKEMSVSTLEEFKVCSTEDLCLYHFGLGTWIRNNLLSEASELYQTFLKNNITDRDEMSEIIIKAFHQHLQQ